MIKIKNIQQIYCSDWDNLVRSTYNRPYCFQQQEGCQSRGSYSLTIPCEYVDELEEEMNDSIPEEINGEEMGVKFKSWLERDPTKLIGDHKEDYYIELFWERNFYPNIETIATDLYNKGLISAGTYEIKIDW